MDAFEAISSPESSTRSTPRRFTLQEANRALTLVRRIVADVVREYAALQNLHMKCRECDTQDSGVIPEKLREEYVATADHLAALREELEEVGCELKDYATGLVDFPSRIDGRDVLLCWMLGEEKVTHWHEVDAGFAGRQPVGADWA